METTPRSEFEGIFEPTPSRPVMSKPQRMKASKEFVHEVAAMLGVQHSEDATEAADWIADKMERFGARTARPVFDMHGNGPQCSWCGAIWPLCGDAHLSEELDDEEGADV